MLFCIFAFLLSKFEYNDYVYTSGISIWKKNVQNQLLIDVYRWIIGFVGSTCVFVGIKFIMSYTEQKKVFWKMMGKLGNKSLGLYIVSNYIFSYVLLRITSVFRFRYLTIFIETILIIGISYMITVLISKNIFMKKVLFGGR